MNWYSYLADVVAGVHLSYVSYVVIGELLIVIFQLLLDRIELSPELLVRGQNLPQAHERPHDLNAHGDRGRTAQHG